MKKAFLLYIKGMAMGAVDVVPGFSGGTMALITGIYDRLLAALAATPQALMLFVLGRIAQAWQACDASFLLVLLLGVLTSVFTLAKGISFLMAHHPVPLWAFFFGLVMVSIWLVAREVGAWRWDRLLALVAGTVFAVWITLAAPLQLTADPLTLFFAGALAICAMILPGISGSFILVLLGLYPAVLGAVKGLDIPLLAVFALGCALGLMSFSRLLSWLLSHLRDLTLAFLAGIILGSLGLSLPFIDFGVTLVTHVVLFALIYKVLPDAHIRWSDVLVGASMTALLFAIGKHLIGLYLGSSSTTMEPAVP